MRVQFAIVLSLICGPALAGENIATQSQASTPSKDQPVSIGRRHSCADSYPTAALSLHAEGTTTLSFTIKTDGSVKDIRLVKSSLNRDLDSAAAACVATWLYKPATKDSIPVETPWVVNVAWKIPNPDMERAVQCLPYRKDKSPMPSGAGTTSLTFRVMPDGTMRDISVSRSSGNPGLDDAAVACFYAAHYDTAIITLPPDGIPGHADLDWTHVTVPPKKP